MTVIQGEVEASVSVGVWHRRERERERRRSRTQVVGEGERGRRQAVLSPLCSSARSCVQRLATISVGPQRWPRTILTVSFEQLQSVHL